MHRFDARVRTGHLWLIGVVPPVLTLLLVQGWANGLRHGDLTAGETLALFGWAQLMPLVALGWMLTSVAAYTVTPDCIVVHRVLFDRTFPLRAGVMPTLRRDGVILVRAGAAGLRLFPCDAVPCLAAVREATERWPERPD